MKMFFSLYRLVLSSFSVLLISGLTLSSCSQPPSSNPKNRALAALEYPEENARLIAASRLGEVGDPETFPALARHLHTDTPAVREAVARLLGRFPPDKSLPELIHSLSDPESRVRRAAVASLVDLGADAKARLKKEISSLSGVQRDYAWIALGMLGEEDAVRPLQEILEGGKGESATLAGAALGRCGEGGIRALKESFETGLPSPGAAANVLVELGEAGPAYLASLAGDQNMVAPQRSAALEALVKAPSPEHLPLLYRLVKDPIADIRLAAVAALAVHSAAPVSGALLTACFDPVPLVALRAQAVLSKRVEPSLLQSLIHPGSEEEAVAALDGLEFPSQEWHIALKDLYHAHFSKTGN